ncbi:MAG: DUF6169 family protein [Flavobacterium sp.]
MYQYILEEGRDPLFYFTTKYGLKYFVSFRKMNFDSDFFENLYSIDFGETNNQKFFNDPEIEITITTIINNYLIMNPTLIVYYICDSIDLKQNFRKKLFDKWYIKTQKKEFSKVNFHYEISHENINYHLGFIFKTEFYEFQEVVDKVNFQLDEFTTFK